MSLERVIKALEILGLTRLEAELYVYVAKDECQTIQGLDNALNYSKKHINASLKTLIEHSLINTMGDSYYAIPFEDALELLIEREKQQAQCVQKIKKELVG